ncbi:MAG: M56 family metallopeptidase [Planctomycetota bacterium]
MPSEVFSFSSLDTDPAKPSEDDGQESLAGNLNLESQNTKQEPQEFQSNRTVDRPEENRLEPVKSRVTITFPIVITAWTIGCFALLLGICRSAFAVFRIKKSSEEIQNAQLHQSTKQVAGQLNLAQFPVVATSRDIGSPVVVGFGRGARILLPVGFVDDLSQEQLSQVLIHEVAHILRRDPMTQMFARFVIAVWWWCPLVWILDKKLRQASEEACDDFVISNFEPAQYGTTLLTLGKLMNHGLPTVGTAGIFGSKWNLERRIRGILDPRRSKMTQVSKRMIVLVAALLASFAAVCSVTRLSAQDGLPNVLVDNQPTEEKKKRLANQPPAAKTSSKQRLSALDRGDTELAIRDRQIHLEKLADARTYLLDADLPELVGEVERRARVVELELKELQRARIPKRNASSGMDDIELTKRVLGRLQQELASAKTDEHKTEVTLLLDFVKDSEKTGDYKSWQNIIDVNSFVKQSPKEPASNKQKANDADAFQQEMRDSIQAINQTIKALQDELKQIQKDRGKSNLR